MTTRVVIEWRAGSRDGRGDDGDIGGGHQCFSLSSE